MTALELLSTINQALFVGLFVAVLWHALREPSRARWNTVFLFGSIAGAVMVSRVAGLLGVEGPWVTSAALVLLNAAPLAMLRLVDDFSGTPRWVQWAGLAAFAVVSALSVVAFETQPVLVELALIGWFGAVGGYAAYAFARAASRSRGITRARMAAVAIGAISFIGAIIILFVSAVLQSEALSALTQLIALCSVVAFFLGFAPPSWIRRAWREPDLRRFLQRSIHLPTLQDERQAVVELQRAAADAFGASGASIGLADPDRAVLRYPDPQDGWVEFADDAYIGGRAFTSGQRVVALDATRDDPEHAETYQQFAAQTVIAAPIISGEQRLGVLTLYAARSPIFIEDDMWLLELLADHTAVLLEARSLSTQAADVRSREDSARLKEEFLSAAAHDLRTPLTVVLGQAELLERRLARNPGAPVDPAGVARIARESRRLRDLVSELLDVQRLDQGGAVMEMVETDLRDVVTAVHDRLMDHGIDLRVDQPDGAVISAVDEKRIEQVLDNLVENAVKYTSSGRLPEIELRMDGDVARLAVVDHGVGIPSEERERIFERFYRAANGQGVTDTGMGLGLYICRRIVEAHGGRIWAEPTADGGSTFVVTLPALSVPAGPETTAAQEWPMTAAEAVADA